MNLHLKHRVSICSKGSLFEGSLSEDMQVLIALIAMREKNDQRGKSMLSKHLTDVEHAGVVPALNRCRDFRIGKVKRVQGAR